MPCNRNLNTTSPTGYKIIKTMLVKNKKINMYFTGRDEITGNQQLFFFPLITASVVFLNFHF